MRVLLFVLSFLLYSPISAKSASGEGWRLVRTVGMIDMVLIDRAHEKNKDTYRLAIGSVCSRKLDFCKVLFWTDGKMVPASMPMTGAQAHTMKADWVFNGKTGFRQLLWSCEIDSDPNQCFKP